MAGIVALGGCRHTQRQALTRLANRATLGGIAAVVLMTAPGGAQAYPQLHVVALSQRADRATVAPGDVFVVTIHVRISQQRERLDELILGTFDNCEITSNETVRTAVAGGTDFIERLTVEALAPGEATISPAYIDALDPSIGKAMRFSSNPIRVRVSGGGPPDAVWQGLADRARRLLLAVLLVAAFAASIFVLGVLFLRGRKRRPAPPIRGPLAVSGGEAKLAEPLKPPDERLARAAQAYDSGRSPAALAELREVLFEFAGVRRGATLLDALQALGERDPRLRAALLAAERAAFAAADERAAAGDELVAAVQAYDGRRAANQDVWTR